MSTVISASEGREIFQGMTLYLDIFEFLDSDTAFTLCFEAYSPILTVTERLSLSCIPELVRTLLTL